MASSVQRRVEQLEAKLQAKLPKLSPIERLLDIMGQYPCGDQEVMEAIADHGKYESGRFPELSAADRAVAGMLMDIFDLELPPIARVERLERLRGRVPDRVLAAAYNTARNYAFGDPETVALVRERAGVIDKGGTVMPGYVLWDNGCILDAAEVERWGWR